jgi:DNA-binding response OmpR family regulator
MQQKILIIDDDRILSSIYRNKFTHAGFAVELAESGEMGLEKLSKNVPDLVLLDLMLGDMNGLEVLTLLRQHPATKALPVVVFSSAFMDNLMESAAAAGATKCLSKTSCPPHILVEEVRKILVPPAAPAGLSAPPIVLAPTMRPTAIATPAAAAPPAPARAGPVSAAAAAAAMSEPDISGTVRADLLELIRQRLEEATRTLPRWLNSAHVPAAPYLGALYRSVHAIAGSAGLAGRLRLGQVAGATEALLKDLKITPASVTASTLRTVTQAIELMPRIAHTSDSPEMEAFPSPLIAVIEPDAPHSAAICSALEKAQLRALQLETPDLALALAQSNRFDLIILEVEVQSLDGFALCAQLRATPLNTATPIVFLVSRDDLEARTFYTQAGATDFISRPVLPIELALKALVHLHTGRMLQPVAVN